MKWITHILSPLLPLIIYVLPYSDLASILFISCLAGTVFPDLMETIFHLPHRSRIFHETGLYLILLVPSIILGFSTITLFLLFALHHLFLDAMTVHGIYVFGKIINGNLNTNSVVDNAMIIMIHTLLPASFTGLFR
ncbi:MAG: hypothetical protein QXJ72_06860 [Thermoproteota archaeon]